MRNIINAKTRMLLAGLIFLFAALPAQAEDYDALKGLNSIKAVFDVRAGAPKSAAVFLDLILQTYRDSNIRAVTGKPDFSIVFIGPAVKLISTDTKGFPPEDQEHIANIARIVNEMAREGFKLEICIYAARLLGVEPATILPEIKQVENGWISVIGYQAKGYALVPAY